MRALRETREMADYQLTTNMSRNEVCQQVERCRQVLSASLQIQTIRESDRSDVA